MCLPPPRRGEKLTPMSAQRRTAAPPQPLLWHCVAAAGALLFLGIVLWKVSPGLRSDDYQSELAGEIVEAHLRSLQPGHMAGIACNDEYAARGWVRRQSKILCSCPRFRERGFCTAGWPPGYCGRPLCRSARLRAQRTSVQRICLADVGSGHLTANWVATRLSLGRLAKGENGVLRRLRRGPSRGGAAHQPIQSFS